jgi:hypothetical protein
LICRGVSSGRGERKVSGVATLGSRVKSLRGNKMNIVMPKFDFIHSTYCKLLSQTSRNLTMDVIFEST